MNYAKAPVGWSFNEANPFTEDGTYGFGWSCFCIRDAEDNQIVTGKSGNGPFSARLGRGVEHLEHRLADFLRYETAQGRTVIVSLPGDIEVESFVNAALAHTPAASAIRPDDPHVIVHSTTMHAWEHIQVGGVLKATSQLPARHRAAPVPSEIDRYLQHEPPEYQDYIMFGLPDSTATEMVVASYQAGRFVLSDDAIYEPGIRLYFDNHRLITDGLITRDGLHLAKVYKHLPLIPYLLAAIGVPDVDPARETAHWTLRMFVEQTNALFRAASS